MKKLLILIILVCVAGGIYSFAKKDKSEVGTQVENDPLNISYIVHGNKVTFVNGEAEVKIPDGSDTNPPTMTTEKITVFGEPTYGDLDKDGDKDAVMYITSEPGGSGIFYYVVVALLEDGKYVGTDAMFLGDRIAPQNINIIDGRAVANYADRGALESFAVRPSIGKSVWIHLDKPRMQIGEWVKDFEGESR